MTTEASPMTVAAFTHLYRNPRVGDLIIRTSDDVEFHIYKAIIGGASAVFADMLSLPQPALSGARDSGKPSVDVAESSLVWQTLIMLCYAPRPPTREDFDDLDAVRALLDAGVKYQMDVVTEYARLGLLLPEFVGTKPFAVYALGCAYKLPDVMRAAARQSLRFPIYFDYSPELELLPMRAYHHLSEYRRECSAVAQTLVSFRSTSSSWSPSRPPKKKYVYRPLPGDLFATYKSRDCEACFSVRSHEIPTFVEGAYYSARATVVEYLQSLHIQLQSLPDESLALSTPLLQAMIKPAMHCTTCVHTIHERVAKFSEALYAALDNAISQVELEVDE